VPAPLDDKPPLFAREGSAIPLNLAQQHFNQPADRRGFAVFPGRHAFEARCYEDDGESEAYRQGKHEEWRLSVSADAERLSITIGKVSGAQSLILLLPANEKRAVTLAGASLVAEDAWENWRRLEVGLSGPI
jgi:alpha-glucosidase